MQTYYSFTQFFANVSNAHPNITTFSMDDIREIDSEKQTLFPLANLIVNNCTIASGLMQYNITYMVMDRVVEVKETSEGPFNTITKTYTGYSNVVDVHNSTLLTINDVISYIYRNPDALDYNVIGSSLCTPFEERFSNLLAGWAVTMDIAVGNPQDMCVINLNSILAAGGDVTC